MAGNLVKPLLSLYGTEWRELGYGLSLHVQYAAVHVFLILIDRRPLANTHKDAKCYTERRKTKESDGR